MIVRQEEIDRAKKPLERRIKAIDDRLQTLLDNYNEAKDALEIERSENKKAIAELDAKAPAK
jgi:hypothetical protein